MTPNSTFSSSLFLFLSLFFSLSPYLPTGKKAFECFQFEIKDRSRGRGDDGESGFSWSADEEIFTQLQKGQVNIYDGKVLGKQVGHLRYKGLAQYALARNTAPPYTIAVLRPEKNAEPAKVSIHRYPREKGLSEFDAVEQKSFFKADEVALRFSPNGKGLLIQTATESSEASYYGETSLYLLMESSLGEWRSFTVPFGTSKGPIEDVQWSPSSREFVAVQGIQPAQVVLFRAEDCAVKHHFGRQDVNTLRWSPHGRFVMLGGFGNIPGKMQFWDKNKQKMMGKAVDVNSPTIFEWAPDGRHFITATLNRRMKVDNGVKVFTYYGQQLSHVKFDRLWDCHIRPALPGVYPDRPQSPKLNGAFACFLLSSSLFSFSFPSSLCA